jgi:hypothetical protein
MYYLAELYLACINLFQRAFLQEVMLHRDLEGSVHVEDVVVATLLGQ